MMECRWCLKMAETSGLIVEFGRKYQRKRNIQICAPCKIKAFARPKPIESFLEAGLAVSRSFIIYKAEKTA